MLLRLNYLVDPEYQGLYDPNPYHSYAALESIVRRVLKFCPFPWLFLKRPWKGANFANFGYVLREAHNSTPTGNAFQKLLRPETRFLGPKLLCNVPLPPAGARRSRILRGESFFLSSPGPSGARTFFASRAHARSFSSFLFSLFPGGFRLLFQRVASSKVTNSPSNCDKFPV